MVLERHPLRRTRAFRRDRYRGICIAPVPLHGGEGYVHSLNVQAFLRQMIDNTLPNRLVVVCAMVTRNQSCQKEENAESHALIICE